MKNPLFCEIDLAQEGKQFGYLRLPHSVHRSAYGWIPIPIASIRNGEGPTILIMAGNHGDEYEGQIIVSRLIRELDAAQVRGQLILLPMANYPAASAGLRVSPLDDGNLNRLFPGDPKGTPTQIIADYIEHTLMPGCRYVVDLHSGGSSLLYHGGCLLTIDPGEEEARTALRGLMQKFDVPHACLLDKGTPAASSWAALRQGATPFISELAGGGFVSPDVLQRAWNGVLNFLTHVQALQGVPVEPVDNEDMRFLRIEAARHYVYAYEAGLFEPLVALGADIEAGQPVARLHHPETPGREPTLVRSPGAGLVLCKRVPAQTQRGDCLYQLAAAL
ncbi:succinylglutamate desuccinylase/aspartoacylase family protein [Bordetella trematum]|uniref:succinylglutamate desuccinylase/aspartoacylase family protein n=1 Tax=Bordetella trematum TaxID=123899 RepID=UPI0013FD70C1|nr:succinylglutamate desuccinylase/aspartoacylase family protein [Bordetella trematum]